MNAVVAAVGRPPQTFPSNQNGGALPRRRYGWSVYLHHAALLSTLNPQLSTAHAQQFTLDWHTLDGGGGTSTGGTFSVSSTIGQPDAGAMSDGNFSLTGGFWSLFSAVQTPGAPLLSIRQNTNHGITIEWPRPADGWTLERTAALGTNAAATVWTPLPPPYQTNATHVFLTTNAPPGHSYFRLRNP